VGTASVTCKTVATSRSLIPRAGVASELRIAERLQRHCCVIGKRILFPPAPSERGAWFPSGAALPHLVPMDPWKRVCSRTHELQATCRKLCRAASHGPMFARRRGLVIAPGLLHVGGHGQASPLPKQRHCRNPASKSSDASSEHFRSPRAWAGRVSTVGGSPAGRRLIAAFFTRGTIHYSIDSMQTDAPDAVIPSIPDPALCPRLLANNLPFQRTKPYGESLNPSVPAKAHGSSLSLEGGAPPENHHAVRSAAEMFCQGSSSSSLLDFPLTMTYD
jgi:hypothetical protein